LLRAHHVARRRPQKGIAVEKQGLHPLIGLAVYAVTRALSPYAAESARFALSAPFEKQVLKHLNQGDHLIGGLGYLNRCIEKVHGWGGLVLLDARNSHPSSFWSIVAEEYGRWDIKTPPIWPRHHMRQQRSAAIADYFFVPSHFVRQSFVDHDVAEEKLLYLPYPVDLENFRPPATPRPADRPLTLICSGGISLRKGAPYLFEALGIVRKEVPDVRLKAVNIMDFAMDGMMKRMGFDKLPVEWTQFMGHEQLVSWLHGGDIFVLPTLEEGMVRTAAEAMACGLPVVTTPNSGINDHITEGVNGSIVPIRDPEATAAAILSWWEKIRRGEHDPRDSAMNREALSFETFSNNLLRHLRSIGL
jgi:glycosyltransferase involved in cell wall biosynthesis